MEECGVVDGRKGRRVGAMVGKKGKERLARPRDSRYKSAKAGKKGKER